MSSFEPSEGAGEVYPGEEIARRFLVARCDASELFDVIEEAFDQIAFGIEREIAGSLDLAVGLGRNHHGDRARFEAGDEVIGVIAFVAEKGSGLDLGGQCFGLGDVVGLAAGEAQREGIAESVDDHMDFGREAAARPPDGLVGAVFF